MPRTVSFVDFLVLCALLSASITGCSADSSPAAAESDTQSRYTQGAVNYDGIGKIYMGREISHVMGHRGAAWLERSDRVASERTDLLIDLLPLKPNSVVADIGAGTGYFAFPIAERVPQGRVLAVDIQQEMLDIISDRQRESGVENIERLLSTEQDPALPVSSVDLVLIVDAYHEFSFPYEMGKGIQAALRPGGILALVEYRAEDRAVPIKRLHKMTEAQAILEMEAVGLEWVRTLDDLPQQHLMLFQKPDLD
ncbi:MAG: class I SAM-dependent methyltransferase [Pseudomonadota bacterium]